MVAMHGKLGQQRLQHTLAIDARQTTPTGVRSRHPLTRGITQEHRQAIGHHDGASQLVVSGPTSIRLRQMDPICRQRLYLCAMNLVHEHGGFLDLVGEKVTVGLNLNNLFDEKYYERSYSNLWVMPGEPRNLSFNLTVDL